MTGNSEEFFSDFVLSRLKLPEYMELRKELANSLTDIKSTSELKKDLVEIGVRVPSNLTDKEIQELASVNGINIEKSMQLDEMSEAFQDWFADAFRKMSTREKPGNKRIDIQAKNAETTAKERILDRVIKQQELIIPVGYLKKDKDLLPDFTPLLGPLIKKVEESQKTGFKMQQQSRPDLGRLTNVALKNLDSPAGFTFRNYDKIEKRIDTLGGRGNLSDLIQLRRIILDNIRKSGTGEERFLKYKLVTEIDEKLKRPIFGNKTRNELLAELAVEGVDIDTLQNQADQKIIDAAKAASIGLRRWQMGKSGYIVNIRNFRPEEDLEALRKMSEADLKKKFEQIRKETIGTISNTPPVLFDVPVKKGKGEEAKYIEAPLTRVGVNRLYKAVYKEELPQALVEKTREDLMRLNPEYLVDANNKKLTERAYREIIYDLIDEKRAPLRREIEERFRRWWFRIKKAKKADRFDRYKPKEPLDRYKRLPDDYMLKGEDYRFIAGMTKNAYNKYFKSERGGPTISYDTFDDMRKTFKELGKQRTREVEQPFVESYVNEQINRVIDAANTLKRDAIVKSTLRETVKDAIKDQGFTANQTRAAQNKFIELTKEVVEDTAGDINNNLAESLAQELSGIDFDDVPESYKKQLIERKLGD